MSKNIVVIGGGAAGFFSAIQAVSTDPNATVTLLEGSKSPLAKVLISGGGRCNVTNHTLMPQKLIENYPRGSRELRSVFSRFGVQDTIKWFEGHGAKLKVEPDGRMFPQTDQSSTIANCLTDVAQRLGIQVLKNRKVVSLKHSKTFTIKSSKEESISAERVILCTGGVKSGFGLAESLGHTIQTPVPSLFTFQITHPLITDLAGLSFQNAEITLKVANKRFRRIGPVLVTHWGISGPAAIQLSSIAARELHQENYKATLIIRYDASLDTSLLIEQLMGLKTQDGAKHARSISFANIPKRFWMRTLELAEVSVEARIADCSKKQIQHIAQLLTQEALPITGKGVFKEEFVTCGGVTLSEVDFKSMQSKIIPGLYFAGEVLDIDGMTGGFNFQNAWSTGWIAGSSAALD